MLPEWRSRQVYGACLEPRLLPLCYVSSPRGVLVIMPTELVEKDPVLHRISSGAGSALWNEIVGSAVLVTPHGTAVRPVSVETVTQWLRHIVQSAFLICLTHVTIV